MSIENIEAVARVLEASLTVGQLRRAIEGLPDDVPVLVSSNYGNRARTEQVLAVDDVLELDSTCLKESGYSTSGIALTEDEGDEDDGVAFVLLKS